MMKNRLRAALTAAVLTMTIAACGTATDEATSGPQSQEKQSGSSQSEEAKPDQPKVVRDAETKLPEITFSDQGIPSMKPLDEAAPKDITVQVLKAGDGAEIGADDVVTVNYAGFLWDDGKQFDSSFERDTPATFSLNQVIAGWKWGLAGSRVGDTVEIAIPAEFGYGERGSEPNIPPNAALVFVVEIVDSVAISTDVLKEAQMLEPELPGGLKVTGELGEEPAISFAPNGKAPKEAETIVLAEGTGPVITDTDTIVFHYSVVTWGSSDVLETTWESQPIQQPASSLPQLLGTKVGSRVVMTMPGNGELDSTGAFVIDIVAAFPS